MKATIVKHIYNSFENWAPSDTFYCKKGCATCCTQNVTMTAAEGSIILQHIVDNDKQKWFAEKLQTAKDLTAPPLTTNEYASACFNGEDVDPGSNENFAPCPFLEDNTCTIYEVRPFGCRCFGSEKKCDELQHAVTPEYYLSGSTAMYQVIEHLDQGWYWGNMLDVMLIMSQMRDFSTIGQEISNQELLDQAKLRIKPAKPLPGFLLLEEDQPHVNPLMEEIFATKIDHRTVEEILNGK